MASAENERLFHRWIEEAWNQGNLAVLDELVAPTFVRHGPGNPQGWRGPDGMREFITLFRTAFPDLRITVEDLVTEGEKAAYRGTARGTHRGDLMGVPPTGRPMSVTYSVLCRIAGGRFEEDWLDYDALGMLQQLGAVPT